MFEEILTFGKIETEKNKFHRYRSPIYLEDIDIENVLVSNKIFSGGNNYKYFIGYFCGNYKIKPLHVILPKSIAYVKIYDGLNKWMYFLIVDDDLLNKYNTVWDKVSAHIKKDFDSEPVCNKIFLKTKINSYVDKATDFHDKEVPNVDCNYNCLAVISLDSALKKDGNCYPQVFLKECKYIEK